MHRCIRVLLYTVVFACSAPGDRSPGAAVDARPGSTLRVVLAPQWSIGGAGDTVLVFESLSERDLAVDPQNRVLVIDRAASRIAVLDADGALTDSWGRAGAGPGELQFPLSVAVAPDSTVHVFDSGKNRFVTFRSDGRVGEELPLVSGRPFHVRFLADGSTVGLTRTGGDSVRLQLLRDGSLRTLAAAARPATRSTPPVCRVTDYPVEPIFTPMLLWDARDTRIVHAAGDYAISVLDHGTDARVLARDTVKRRSNRDLARRHVGEGPILHLEGMKPCRIPADMVLEVAEIAPELPAYASLTIAPDETIWARRFTLPGEPAIADLYHPEQGYLESVGIGDARPVAFLNDGRLISIERDADEVPVVRVYTVRR